MPTRVVHVSLAIFGAVLTVLLITTFPILYPATIFGAESISEAGAGSVQVAARSTPIPVNPAVNAPAETPTPTVTPTDMPTIEPTFWIDTTTYVTPTNSNVVAGQSITITPQLVVAGTCGFSIYDVTLNQEPQLFAYSDPTSNVVRGSSAAWRLTAFRAGITTFTAIYYGETYCNGVWQWSYASGQSQPVTVTGGIFGLPTIGKGP